MGYVINGASGSSVTAADITDSSASGRTVLTGTAAAGLAALGGAGSSSGVDTSRPTPTAALIGSFYHATDSGQVYVCESDGAGGARWRNVATGHLDTAAVTVLGNTSQLVGVTNRANPSTGTLVLVFGGSALPSATCHMAGNYGSGCAIEIGDTAGDRGLLSFYRSGSTATRVSLTGATINGSLNTAHYLAISLTPTTLRWSFDGGAAQGVAQTGSPSGSSPWNVGGSGSPFTTGIYWAFRVLAEAASDADLALLSAVRTDRRIISVASAPTVKGSWYASGHQPGSLGSRWWGSEPDAAGVAGSVVARFTSL